MSDNISIHLPANLFSLYLQMSTTPRNECFLVFVIILI